MKIMKALERMATAVAFAEAGEWDTAVSEIRRGAQAKKILVAYEGDPADRRLIQYALGVAQRVKCDMLFAYISPAQQTDDAMAGSRNIEKTSGIGDVISRSFYEAFEHEVALLKRESPKVAAKQIVMTSGFRESIRSICREVRDIEFIIFRCESAGCDSRIASELRLDIPYFFFK